MTAAQAVNNETVNFDQATDTQVLKFGNKATLSFKSDVVGTVRQNGKTIYILRDKSPVTVEN